MKKSILTAALALAIGLGATAPAHANQTDGRDFLIWQRSYNPIAILIALLLPAVQAAPDY